jgi:hypothetical protein
MKTHTALEFYNFHTVHCRLSIAQYSAQQNTLLLCADILYYNICKSIQHVSMPHGIIIGDSYKNKMAQTELTVCVHVRKI